MTEDEKAAADKARKDEADLRAKADAEAGEKLDKLLSHLDSIGKRIDAVCGRMDAYEEREKARDDAAKKDAEDEKTEDEKKADGEEETAEKKSEPEAVAADKKRKDAEGEAEEKAKADAGRSDAVAALEQRITDIAKQLPRAMTDADFRELANAQSRADGVMSLLGGHAPRPMQAESLQEYRLRMANELKKHSAAWKDVNLAVIAVDSAAFEIAERAIYEDAKRAALDPGNVPAGKMLAMTRKDSGREITEFLGRHSFVRDFSRPRGFVTGFPSGEARHSR